LNLKQLYNKCDVLTTAGTYSYSEGSQCGILALHQLMQPLPLLPDSRKQVSKLYC